MKQVIEFVAFIGSGAVLYLCFIATCCSWSSEEEVSGIAAKM